MEQVSVASRGTGAVLKEMVYHDPGQQECNRFVYEGWVQSLGVDRGRHDSRGPRNWEKRLARTSEGRLEVMRILGQGALHAMALTLPTG
jgi:hypothetical protein